MNRRRSLAIMGCFGILASVGVAGTAFHPIHTTYSEITQSRSGEVTLIIRGFEDDLAAAAAADTRPGATPDIARYLLRRIALEDRRGRPVRFNYKESRRAGQVIWFTFEGARTGELEGGRLAHGVLTERHVDQVNLVQIKLLGRTRTLMFTRGSGIRDLVRQGP